MYKEIGSGAKVTCLIPHACPTLYLFSSLFFFFLKHLSMKIQNQLLVFNQTKNIVDFKIISNFFWVMKILSNFVVN